MKTPRALGWLVPPLLGAVVAVALIRGVDATAAPASADPPDLTSPDAVVSTSVLRPLTPPKVVIKPVTVTAAPITVTVPAPAAPPPPSDRSSTTTVPLATKVVPTAIRIPAIGVSSRNVIPVGLNADQSLQAPPLAKVGVLGWYKLSPVPGATGPSVVDAHDEQQGHHGLFWSLGQLGVGGVVEIDRSDGQTATFRVTQNLTVPKADFDQYKNVVYGPTSEPELRLITCSGLTSQEVVFANLISLRPTVGHR
jgi:sortase (surface protein transpeptidase)